MTGMPTARATSARQLAVEARARAVAIDRRQQDLAGAPRLRLPAPTRPRRRRVAERAAARIDLEAARSARFASIATTTAWLP